MALMRISAATTKMAVRITWGDLSASWLAELRPILPCGDPRGELEHERGYTRRALRVDAFPVVARTMVIVVEAGEKMQRRHTAVDERGVVAPPGSRPAPAHVQPGNLCRGLHVRFERGRRVQPADFHLASRSADHVEVDHGDGLVERNGRFHRVVQRPEQ